MKIRHIIDLILFPYLGYLVVTNKLYYFSLDGWILLAVLFNQLDIVTTHIFVSRKPALARGERNAMTKFLWKHLGITKTACAIDMGLMLPLIPISIGILNSLFLFLLAETPPLSFIPNYALKLSMVLMMAFPLLPNYFSYRHISS